jgi:ParB family chromosome partitioning protein
MQLIDHALNNGVDGAITMIAINDITVGGRIRQAMEYMDELTENIQEFGLLEPIIVMRQQDGKYLLLAGQRRLAAVTKLGYDVIEAKVLSPMDTYHALMVEISENEQRQQFTHMERLQYGGSTPEVVKVVR